MPAFASRLAPVLLLSWFILPATADESDDVSSALPAPASAGDAGSGMSSAREAALRSTLEKRKAKRVRDRVAYQRSAASANAMMLSSVRPGPRPPGMFSRPPGYASNAAALDPTTGRDGGYPGAFNQAAGQGGNYGVVSAGGTGGCQRR